jgi:hypothetical protein
MTWRAPTLANSTTSSKSSVAPAGILGLRGLHVWQDGLQIPANSAFLDGTLLMTADALLGPDGPDMLTPVTLWELTAFVDALVCFDRLSCGADPAVDVSRFNRRLGAKVLTAIPDLHHQHFHIQ